MPSFSAPRLTVEQRRFLRVRSGLYLLRYAVIAGVLLALAAFGVLH